MVYSQANSHLQAIIPVFHRHYNCLHKLYNLDHIKSLPEENRKTIDNLSADLMFLQESTRHFLKQCCHDTNGTRELAGQYFKKVKDCLSLHANITKGEHVNRITGYPEINHYLWRLNDEFPFLLKQLKKGLAACTIPSLPGNKMWNSLACPSLPAGTAAFPSCDPRQPHNPCTQGIPFIPYSFQPPLQAFPLQTPEIGLLSSASGMDRTTPPSEQTAPILLPERKSHLMGTDIARVDKAQEELDAYLSKTNEEHFSKEIKEMFTRIEDLLNSLVKRPKGKKNPGNTFKGRLYLLLKAEIHSSLLLKFSKKATYNILARFCDGNKDDCAKYVRCYMSEEAELNGTAPPEKVSPGQRERNMKYSMRGLYPEVDERFELLEKSRKKK